MNVAPPQFCPRNRNEKLMSPRTFRVIAVACALLATGFGLTACSSPAPVVTASGSPSSKDAGLFTKDVFVCIENTSDSPVTIAWTYGVSSTTGSGQFAPGQKTCGEGGSPEAKITFGSGFATLMSAANPALSEPAISFLHTEPYQKVVCVDTGSCSLEWTRDKYITQWYSVGPSLDNDVEGHHIVATRTADNGWINFSAKIVN
jgi:hypothetical protein